MPEGLATDTIINIVITDFISIVWNNEIADQDATGQTLWQPKHASERLLTVALRMQL